ncbi:hypothetical protein ACJX0J_024995, partial [Zea mays]
MKKVAVTTVKLTLLVLFVVSKNQVLLCQAYVTTLTLLNQAPVNYLVNCGALTLVGSLACIHLLCGDELIIQVKVPQKETRLEKTLEMHNLNKICLNLVKPILIKIENPLVNNLKNRSKNSRTKLL